MVGLRGAARLIENSRAEVSVLQRIGVDGNVEGALLHQRPHHRVIGQLLCPARVAVAELAADAVVADAAPVRADGVHLAGLVLGLVRPDRLRGGEVLLDEAEGDLGVAALAAAAPVAGLLLAAVH